MLSAAATSASPGARSCRARKYTGTAVSDMTTALMTFAAWYALGTAAKSPKAGAISTG